MKKELRRFIVGITGLVIVSGISGWPSIAENQGPVQSPHDGTLRVHELTIPPSDYWSPEFRAAYASMVAEARKITTPQPDPHPARTAPRAEWDKLYVAQAHDLAPLLKTDLAKYPVDIEDTAVAGVHAGIITPKGGVSPENRRRILINLHGGGFVDFTGLSFGELESIPVSSIGRIKVITLDYRQSPYYHYPAASEDVETVYRALLKHYKPEAIGIYGCSAGGVLAAQSIAWLQSKKLPRPGAVGIFCSALADVPLPFGRAGDSVMWGLGVIPENPVQRGTSPVSGSISWYFEGADRHDPRAFPGSADADAVLARFPPVLFLTGTRDLTMSPAVSSHARLLGLGVDSSLYLIEGGWHASHVTAVDSPEAYEANAYIARWFLRHLAP